MSEKPAARCRLFYSSARLGRLWASPCNNSDEATSNVQRAKLAYDPRADTSASVSFTVGVPTAS
jgi:hypothetical protein